MRPDLAEHLGLCKRKDLNAWIAEAGLEVVEKSIQSRCTPNRKMLATSYAPRVARNQVVLQIAAVIAATERW